MGAKHPFVPAGITIPLFLALHQDFQQTLLLLSPPKFLTSQLWLGNIHLSWDVVINRIRHGGLIRSLKTFLQLNMCQELQIFAFVYMCSGAG